MGLDIALVNYKGEILDSVSDPKNFLHKLLPDANEDSKALLSKIDWYGDTFFNYLQMKQFLEEWEDLRKCASTTEEQTLVDGVRGLAVRCAEDRGEYLKFIGD